MNNQKTKKSQVIEKLNQKIKDLETEAIHKHYWFENFVKNLTIPKMIGSYVYVEIGYRTASGFKSERVAMQDGLSDGLISALLADNSRSFEYKIEIKPTTTKKD